ncbi:hypothetical protein NLM33_09675 [Bradyrhizobium sp. CCGUVB1N3]|uniref:hypothetical protein n=1 Tax=Bradyrhizobium sp. CCGUVB1N3 TaxID=2949629 RepID=UPI0020B20821|nr:hypothetical protein [Bradyrhizobium sp. CCGUVB1N3]MCP3470588.1 hypothetical protein [Bradyrhizobium sp. CCGUVB1N3]
MTYRSYGALLASLSAAALLLATSNSFARSGAAPHGVVGAPAAVHPPIAPSARFHRRNSFVSWPGGGGFYYEPSTSDSYAPEMAQPPVANDVRYTYTYDVPWDWAHRYPPNVVPSDRPYVPSCPSETVTVPGRGGEQTVNIMRCY